MIEVTTAPPTSGVPIGTAIVNGALVGVSLFGVGLYVGLGVVCAVAIGKKVAAALEMRRLRKAVST